MYAAKDQGAAAAFKEDKSLAGERALPLGDRAQATGRVQGNQRSVLQGDYLQTNIGFPFKWKVPDNFVRRLLAGREKCKGCLWPVAVSSLPLGACTYAHRTGRVQGRQSARSYQ